MICSDISKQFCSVIAKANGATMCHAQALSGYGFYDFADKYLQKGKKALILSLAGATAATSVNLIANRFRTTDVKGAKTASITRFEHRLYKNIRESASRSAFSSSAGFMTKVGLNMITGGSDITTSVASKVASDLSSKAACRYLPQYAGRSNDSWLYTIAKAGASGIVGTITYQFTQHWTGSPMFARVISGSSSALVEQSFNYLLKNNHKKTNPLPKKRNCLS